MKRKPIQQFEMAFAADNFNLAGQMEKPIAPEPVKIMAEMTPDERETVRLTSKEREIRKVCPGYREGSPIASESTPRPERVEASGGGLTFDGEVSYEHSMPGLAPGSRWSSQPMAKALATMQGGAR